MTNVRPTVEPDGSIRLENMDGSVITIQYEAPAETAAVPDDRVDARIERLDVLVLELQRLVLLMQPQPARDGTDAEGSVRLELAPEDLRAQPITQETLHPYSMSALSHRLSAARLAAHSAGLAEGVDAAARYVHIQVLSRLGVCGTWQAEIRNRWGAHVPVYQEDFWLWALTYSEVARLDVREWVHRLPEPLFSSFFREQTLVWRLHNFGPDTENGERALLARNLARWCNNNIDNIAEAIGRAIHAEQADAQSAPPMANEPIHARDAIALADTGTVSEASLRAAREMLEDQPILPEGATAPLSAGIIAAARRRLNRP